jgi:PAS domain S-box-containing protein
MFFGALGLHNHCKIEAEAIVSLSINPAELQPAGQSLPEGPERFHSLADVAFEGIAVHDQGRILEANQTCAAMFGYEPCDLIGKPLFELSAPESRELVMQHIADGYNQSYEAIGLRKDGTTFPVEIRGKPLMYQGRAAQVTAVRDITQHKAAEEALQQARDALESRVHERTAELATVNRLLTGLIAERRQAEKELRRTNRALRMLIGCSEALVRATQELDLLSQVCRLIVEIGGYPLAWVGFAQQDPEKSVRPIALAGREDSDLAAPDLTTADTEWGASPAGTAMRTGKPCLIRDISSHRAPAPWRAEALRRGYMSCIALPLLREMEITGVLGIYAEWSDAFDDHEAELLMRLANDLAFGIQALRTYAQRQRAEEALLQRAEELSLLYTLGHQVNASLSLDQVVEAALSGIAHSLAPDLAMLYLRQGDELHLQGLKTQHPSLEQAGIPAKQVGECLCGLAVSQNRSFYSGDIHIDPLCTLDECKQAGLRSFAALPLVKGGQVLGVLGLASIAPRDFGQRAPLLEALAGQIAVALQNALLHDQVQHHVAELEREVAERVQAEQALRQSEEYFRALIEEASDFITIVDADGMIRYRSPSARQPLGYDVQEILGENMVRFVHPDDLSKLIDAFNQAVRSPGRPVYVEPRIRDKHGSWRTIEAIGTNLLDNPAVKGIVVNIRDITERKHIEEALQRRNRELELLNLTGQAFNSSLDLDQVLVSVLEEVRSLLDASACSAWLIDRQTDELVCRQAVGSASHAVRGWRLQPGQGIAGWVARNGQSLIVADARTDERHFGGVAAQTGVELRSILALPLRTKQGVLGVLQLLHVEAGRFGERDMELLELLAASAATAIENARLYQDLQDQMLVLREAQARLVQSTKMTALGRLAASIAHEINNPLQSIQNALLLLSEELEGGARPEEVNYCLGIAEDEISRIATIVRRMRDFYWPGYRQQPGLPPSIDDFYRVTPEELQTIDIRAILDNVLQLANKQLQNHNIRVERNWAEHLPLVQANPDYLKQVFLNLTLNATDTMAARGGTLHIRMALDQWMPHPDHPQPGIRIEFGDTGEGMPPEVLSRLFEPFFSTKEHGSGFGLFTSYKIIQAHHGWIGAESHVGLGTTLTILLPLEQPQE